MPHLLPDQGHDADSCQNMLPWQPFPGHTISKRFSVVCSWLTQMSHEQRHIRLEHFLRLVPQISHQPVETFQIHEWQFSWIYLCNGYKSRSHNSYWLKHSILPLWIKCILWWHSISHHSIQESLPLSSIESKHLYQVRKYLSYTVLDLEYTCVHGN